MKTGPYGRQLEELMGLPGIRGALVVAVRDGLIVDGRVYVGVRGEAVAALAGSLFRHASGGTDAAEGGIGVGRFVELEADEGRIMIAGNDQLALMAVVEKRANAGQARLAVRRAASALESVEG